MCPDKKDQTVVKRWTLESQSESSKLLSLRYDESEDKDDNPSRFIKLSDADVYGSSYAIEI